MLIIIWLYLAGAWITCNYLTEDGGNYTDFGEKVTIVTWPVMLTLSFIVELGHSIVDLLRRLRSK